ncbi:bile acid:sodium symporter family protein [Gimibacter soli]|uniref:Bile acid:sodium symporter n=1 Tax=Gimibacter soli TaxID=3024400 RepID=A0AAE9XUI1_9PROT|nr:bile acid:sodium symporter [Gimibacter soli]WCL53823.1 bile acid:sodium symporter [Gimibacter soli]
MERAVVELGAGAQALMAFSIAFTMFSVALGLRLAHFRPLAARPHALLAGYATQLIGLPLLTLALVWLIRPDPSLAFGMILVASCPGGNVSNFYTLMARGNVAYSVTLTALSSVLAALTVPLSVLFWGGLYPPVAALLDEIDINGASFLMQTALMLGLPLVLGMTLAARFPKATERHRPLALRISLALLLGIVIFGLYTNAGLLAEYWTDIVPLTAVHNLLAFALGAGAGALFLRDAGDRRALAFEVGIQNSALGLAILMTQFGGIGGAVMLTATWGIWHFIGGFITLALYRFADARFSRPLHATQGD